MIRVANAHLYTAALSHPGMGGRSNEDRFAISAFRLSENDPTPSVFAIVSDGIGGHRAGEVAAEMAVEQISRLVAQSDGREPLRILQQAIETTSQAIAQQAQDNTQQLGMGTTCACAWIIGSHLYIASVGDSRIYLLRRGRLKQLTTDHTWVQEAIEKGILTPAEAVNHVNQHVIRRYLGSNKPPQVDIRLRLASNETDTQACANQGLALQPGDILLLCTDGLTDVVANPEIEATLRNKNVEQAAKDLVDLACKRQGRDNITVLVLQVPPLVTPKLFPWKWVALGGVAVLLLGIVLVLLVWLMLAFWLPPGG